MVASILAISRYTFLKTFNYNKQQIVNSKVKGVKKTLSDLGKEALYVSSVFSKQDVAIEAYRNYYENGDLKAAAKMIEEKLVPVTKTIEASTGTSPRIHYHLPPATSFIRLWSKKRGDDISSFRKMVLAVSDKHLPVKGVETGRAGYVVRGISPVFDGDKYLGSVEVFFGVEKLLNSVSNGETESFEILLSKDLLHISTKFLEKNSSNIRADKKQIGNYVVIKATKGFKNENIDQAILAKNISEVVSFSKENFEYVVIPIKNFIGDVDGVGILQIDISESQKSLRSSMLYVVLICFISFIILFSVVGYLVNIMVLKRIDVTNVEIRKLAKGENITKISSKFNDQITILETSINKLAENSAKNAKFANALGFGQYEVEYEPISNEDILGNALFMMRQSLKAFSEEMNFLVDESTTELQDKIAKLDLSQQELQMQNETMQLMNDELSTSEEELQQQNEEMQAINDELEKQKEEIQAHAEQAQVQQKKLQEHHTKISDSITYARRIQRGLFPTDALLASLLKEHFILFKPKETVSGDFYYAFKNKNKLVFAAADCTGHGVPGAFLTVLGVTYIHGIVRRCEFESAGDLLDKLREQIKNVFSAFGGKSNNGLDIALCIIDLESGIMQYSGAYNPLYIIRSGAMVEYKATRNPIGSYPKEKKFVTEEITLQDNDQIYLFSDGYQDQLGGEKNRKMGKAKFKQLLLENAHLPMAEQKIKLNQELLKWQGDTEQLDDIVILAKKWSKED